eukprot:TRINITY_DN107_c0_g1_i1.p1 TRINITY_DN107_c0_g1~~TRINITY_DN107_c0_g1_i1.p1  ORF type:complete len:580 (-),score=150.61 TRINITY_DN107_c0_g1_i1:281-2020(-)
MGNANSLQEDVVNEEGFVDVGNHQNDTPPSEVSFGGAPPEVSFSDEPELQRKASLLGNDPEEPIPADDAMDDPDIEDLQLGEYVLHKCPESRTGTTPFLGRGSYATVYEGTHTPTGMPCAIKVIGIGKWFEKYKIRDGIQHFAKHKMGAKQMGYIESEIEALKSIRGHRHPNVVSFYSVIHSTEGRYVYLVSELCEGGTLKDFLQENGGSFDENTARQFLRHLAGGLYFLKTRPGNSAFVHRDLKPENFLLSEPTANATLKIADFGFSRVSLAEDDGMMESVVGTPYYMAPEIHNKQQYNDTVDLWAVGVVLFQSVFGRVLVDISSVSDMEGLKTKLSGTSCYRMYLSEEEKERDKQLSEPCRDLLAKLLQPDPRKRMSFQDFMSHPFIDLATAFVEQGQALVAEVLQRELAQRGFTILREKSDLQAAQFETERAAMYEQDAQSKLELQQLRTELRKLAEEVEQRKKDEQTAVGETIRMEQVVQSLEARNSELASQQDSCVSFTRTEIEEGDQVLFIRKAGEESQVAFEAACASPGKYYLHKDCIMDGMESREFLVGTVFMQEPCEGSSVMLFATLRQE